MAQPGQYPVGVLLDAWGNPFQTNVPPGYFQPPDAPPGAFLPGGYQPTTIIVESGNGRVELTDRDNARRTISYADVYASQPAIGSVVNKLVRQISTLPLKVYQRPQGNASQNGKPKHPTEIHDHPLCELICHPAPGYGTVSLLEWITMPLFVHGNSLVAKFRLNGPLTPPTTLIPLDWRFVQAWARIGEPVLLWATVQTGIMKWIAPSETIYTAWTSPAGTNGAWLGTSPLHQLGVTIAIDEAAQRFAFNHFKNGTRPGGIITLPPTANVQQNPDMVERMQRKAEEAYAGVDKAFRVAVLGGGADWKPWGQTADEAQLTQTREWDRGEIRDLFDLPPDGDTMAPERDAQLYKTTLRPHLKMVDDRLNAQLVQPEPEWMADRLFLKIDLTEVLWGDPLTLSDKMVAEVGAAITTRNEARHALGRDPHPNKFADELIYSGNSEGILGTLPGSLSIGEEEREMVMSDPGAEGIPAPPLEEIDTGLAPEEGG